MELFELQLSWTGTTATADYSRDVTAAAAGKPAIAMSAAPSYGGDPARWNPEDLFGASLATCHTLTFLSLAKKFGIDVRQLEDHVTVTVDTVERVTKITRVRLAPTITVLAGPTPEKVREAYEKAHRYCIVANSTPVEVELAPEVRFA